MFQDHDLVMREGAVVDGAGGEPFVGDEALMHDIGLQADGERVNSWL
jgi:N-acyl-D-aspartate/D-glutamate deacylase